MMPTAIAPPVTPDKRLEQDDPKEMPLMVLEAGCDFALDPPFIAEGTPDNKRHPKQTNLAFSLVTCIAPVSTAPGNMLYQCNGIPDGHTDFYSCIVDITGRMVRLVHRPDPKKKKEV